MVYCCCCHCGSVSLASASYRPDTQLTLDCMTDKEWLILILTYISGPNSVPSKAFKIVNVFETVRRQSVKRLEYFISELYSDEDESKKYAAAQYTHGDHDAAYNCNYSFSLVCGSYIDFEASGQI